MTSRRWFAALTLIAALALPMVVSAQTAAPASAPPSSRGPWVVVGGGSTTLLPDCTDCEDRNYVHGGGLLADFGVAVSQRLDAGGEFVWVPAKSSTGDYVRTSFLMGAVQFRPWTQKGFFIRGSMGMAFVRNWILTPNVETAQAMSKAFGLGLAAGWEWRVTNRFGVQAFGAQHVAALGDLTTTSGNIQNVVGNFWTVGGGIVIR